MARTSFTQKLDNLETEPESLKVEKDKTQILNAITGAKFNATPDLKDPALGLRFHSSGGGELFPGQRPGGYVRGERANFTRLVLGCIEANFCK